MSSHPTHSNKSRHSSSRERGSQVGTSLKPPLAPTGQIQLENICRGMNPALALSLQAQHICASCCSFSCRQVTNLWRFPSFTPSVLFLRAKTCPSALPTARLQAEDEEGLGAFTTLGKPRSRTSAGDQHLAQAEAHGDQHSPLHKITTVADEWCCSDSAPLVTSRVPALGFTSLQCLQRFTIPFFN